jgi:hypothetical protein
MLSNKSNCIFIPLGQDCSVADALRRIDKRKEAYPFDWIRCSLSSILECINTNFERFLKNTRVNRTSVIDGYGFQYPHDFKTVNIEKYTENPIYPEAEIAQDWEQWLPVIQDKYERCIQRFNHSMQNSNIVFVINSVINDNVIQEIYATCNRVYGNKNIYFILINSHNTMLNNAISAHIRDVWYDMPAWETILQKAMDKFSLIY